LLNYYVREGDRERARTLFEQVLALNPPNEEWLRRWFDERMK
jgi:pentatricopeptide repeat protein